MKLIQLKLFALIFKNRSFSKTSEEFGLTQPTISSHIKNLEEELECNLFDRLGRSIIPTKEAEILYPHVLDIIEKVTDMQNAIKHPGANLAGKISIGADTVAGVYLLPYLIADFKKTYPEFYFKVNISNSQEIIDNILQSKVFLGLVSTRLNMEQIAYMDFLQDELIVISSPDLIKKDMITLGELIEFPVVLREEGSGTIKIIEELFESKGISINELKIAGFFGSTDAVKQAVKEGLGFSFISRIVVNDELKNKILKEVKISEVAITNKFYLAKSKESILPKTYITFLEHIIYKSQNANLQISQTVENAVVVP